MGLAPQTLYGLADSPAALAAWMLDHDLLSYRGDEHRGLLRSDLLGDTLDFFDVKGATVPAAVSVFPNELYRAPRSWTERAYPNLVYFNEVEAGNHFAAWQQPELFTTEVRAAFRSLLIERSAHV
jgi:pimeloyl-ACP methyl ester carboxylesterase